MPDAPAPVPATGRATEPDNMLEFLPCWLEDRLIPDAAFAAAYEAVTPQERGALKLAIARLAAVYGVSETVERHTRTTMRQGFTQSRALRPAPWTLVFWDASCRSPANILAALLPALLAGAPSVLACRVGQNVDAPIPAPVLAALELAGQERALDLTPEDALRLVHESAEREGVGRIVALLGSTGRVAGQDSLSVLAQGAFSTVVPCWTVAAPARIAVSAGARAVLREMGENGGSDYGFLPFAQPDAAIIPLPEDAAPGREAFSCVLCAAGEEEAWFGAASLVLTPGQEGCWIWPDLAPAFFLETRIALST